MKQSSETDEYVIGTEDIFPLIQSFHTDLGIPVLITRVTLRFMEQWFSSFKVVWYSAVSEHMFDVSRNSISNHKNPVKTTVNDQILMTHTMTFNILMYTQNNLCN